MAAGTESDGGPPTGRGMTGLAREALRDVREGRVFSTYDADCVLDYFDGRCPHTPRLMLEGMTSHDFARFWLKWRKTK